MKRFSLLLLVAGLLSACSHAPKVAQAPVNRKPVVATEGSSKTAQKVEIRSGVSSATVERLAYAQECRGGQGAGLVSAQGPIEVYRMACSSGKVFMARCELRQCKAIESETASR
ncbi:hypothetical protein [Pseudoduganella violaceinigra]|uniref:hypothetical protein n=1 Tax=Pseudoduganella violaceinigra TaxID=246602 RepID=UPI0004029024|nr:hypothetical protein [Pseudoduganella violaceinigra]